MMGEINPPHNKYYMYKNPNYQKEYRLKNKKKLNAVSKKYYEEHKEELLEKNRDRNKEWYKKNKEYKDKRNKQWFKENPNKIVMYVKKYVENNKEKVKDYNKIFDKTIAGKYRLLKSRHKSRWDSEVITIKEFEEIVLKNCRYCGGLNKTKGIDRIDNENGYINGNVNSCCKKCNYMKNTYSENEFLKHIEKIYNNNYKNIC